MDKAKADAIMRGFSIRLAAVVASAFFAGWLYGRYPVKFTLDTAHLDSLTKGFTATLSGGD